MSETAYTIFNILGAILVLACIVAMPFAILGQAVKDKHKTQAHAPPTPAPPAPPTPDPLPDIGPSSYAQAVFAEADRDDAEMAKELALYEVDRAEQQARWDREATAEVLEETAQVWPDTEILSHILVWGPPGTGKTTLARIMAASLEPVYGFRPRLIELTPMQFQDHDDIDRLAHEIEFGSLVFIDEVHGLSKITSESIYSLLEYGQLSSRKWEYNLPPHTFIGATTEPGTLQEPFRERFPIEVELAPLGSEDILKLLDDLDGGMRFPESFAEYHGQDEAKTLVWMHLAALNRPGYVLPQTVKAEIARRSVGIPRIAKNITRHMLALSKALGEELALADAKKCFRLLGIDLNGLHRSDRRVIKVLLDRNNQPMGMAALASAAGVAKPDLENMVEGRMVRLGYLERTPRGRALTEKAITEYST